MEKVVEMRGITKIFPTVIANNDVDFSLYKGEIHALVGENGAGKTTLMSILYGMNQPIDSGRIFINGKEERIYHPHVAINKGIGMVHQHFMLVPSFTVSENIVLGHEKRKNRILLDKEEAIKITKEISKKHGFLVDPMVRVQDLPLGIQQRIEILKLLYRGADILILDEPTAVLTPQEIKELFSTIRSLVSEGKSIVFITHKLPEVMAISDRVTVMRKGRIMGVLETKKTTMEEIAKLMVGREVLFQVEKEEPHFKEVVLELNNIKTLSDRILLAINGVSLKVRSGEILGIAGIEGNGQTELAEVVTGLRPLVSGEIIFQSKNINKVFPRQRREMGIAHIPEDRLKTGISIDATIQDNLVMGTHYKKPLASGIHRYLRQTKDYAEKLINEYDIRTPNQNLPAISLSGGNLQRLVVAREFSFDSKLLVISQPTRGIDIGSIEFLHEKILSMRDKGNAILLISADLDEIYALSDRIVVMYEGEIVGEFHPDEIGREELGLYMTGAKKEN